MVEKGSEVYQNSDFGFRFKTFLKCINLKRNIFLEQQNFYSKLNYMFWLYESQ